MPNGEDRSWIGCQKFNCTGASYKLILANATKNMGPVMVSELRRIQPSLTLEGKNLQLANKLEHTKIT